MNAEQLKVNRKLLISGEIVSENTNLTYGLGRLVKSQIAVK